MPALSPLNPSDIYASDPRLNGISTQSRVKMRDASQQFEQQYVYQMVELMSPKVDKDSEFSGGSGEEMFRPELHMEMAKQIVQQGGFGVSQKIYNELVATQQRQQIVPAATPAAYQQAPSN